MLQKDRTYLKFLMDLKKLQKGDIHDHLNTWRLKSSTVHYIASVTYPDHLQRIKEWVGARKDILVKDFDIGYFKALYLCVLGEYNIFIISVNPQYNTLKPSILNYSIDSKISDALQIAIEEMGISSLKDYDFDIINKIMTAFDLNIMKTHQLTIDDYYFIRIQNTQKEFVKNYLEFLKDENRIREFNWAHYDHILNFSLNYYAIIKVMSDAYGDGGSLEGFTIHDAGTSNSQLALMLATLSSDQLMGLKVKQVLASDLVLAHNVPLLRYLSQFENAKPVHFIQLDFTDETREIPLSDVTILNDVLEHFPDDATSFYVMERFWERTSKVLIVHVPIEDKPNPAWGHFITFTKEKLKAWGNRLNGGELIGDDYEFKAGFLYTDSGFLIIKKTM